MPKSDLDNDLRPIKKMAQIDQTQNPDFQKWFQGSQAADEQGKPLTLYHGTTHDFDSFSHKLGNPENYYGRAHYLSTHPDDVNSNYIDASGPDLKGRIELETERHPLFDDDPEFARKDVESRFVGPAPRVIPAHVKIKNPVVVQPKGGTGFQIDHQFDDETGEPKGNPRGNGIRLLNSISKVAPRYGIDPGELHSLLYPMLSEGATAHDIERELRSHPAVIEAQDQESGNYSGNEFIRDMWRGAGHDGIILDAYSAFGPKPLSFGGQTKGMEGVVPGTKHYVVFSPNQIKSKFNQTFSRSPKFSKSEDALLEKGAMRRIAPFDPSVDRMSPEQERVVSSWQHNHNTNNRRHIEPMKGAARTRALHDLAASTSARTNPATGEREYLLHRGMDFIEHQKAMGSDTISHDAPSSWTPKYSSAQNFASSYPRGKLVSAWIPEDAIVHVPRQFGAFEAPPGYQGHWTGEKPEGPNYYGAEYEVVVAPHQSKLATQHELAQVLQPQTTLHGRINRGARDTEIADEARDDSFRVSQTKGRLGARLGKSDTLKGNEGTQAVSIIMVRPDNHFLMGKRRDTGRWTCPGGHVEPGEHHSHATIRESVEETGLLPSTVIYKERAAGGPDGSVPVHIYGARVDGEPTADHDPDKEFDEFRWISLDQGLPEDVAQNLHHPNDVSLRLLGMQEGTRLTED